MLAPSNEVPIMPSVAEIELRRRVAAIAHAKQAALLEEQMQRLQVSIDKLRQEANDNG